MRDDDRQRGVTDGGEDAPAAVTRGEDAEGTAVWEDGDDEWSLDPETEGPGLGVDERILDEAGGGGLWFEGEASAYRPGEQFLWAMSGAGLYTLSFAAVVGGFTLVGTAIARARFVELLLNAVVLLAFPLAAYLGVGVAFEVLGWLRRETGRAVVTPSLFATSLVLPVVLHLAQFFFEVLGPGYAAATLSELVVESPVLSQLYLWPPVVVGGGFALVVYRTLDSQD